MASMLRRGQAWTPGEEIRKMRGSFNTFITVYWGPDQPDAGQVRILECQGRWVPQTYLLLSNPSPNLRRVWFTTEAFLLTPVVAWRPPNPLNVQYGLADRVSAPGGGEPRWLVCGAERCIPKGRPPYNRYWMTFIGR